MCTELALVRGSNAQRFSHLKRIVAQNKLLALLPCFDAWRQKLKLVCAQTRVFELNKASHALRKLLEVVTCEIEAGQVCRHVLHLRTFQHVVREIQIQESREVAPHAPTCTIEVRHSAHVPHTLFVLCVHVRMYVCMYVCMHACMHLHGSARQGKMCSNVRCIPK